MEENTNCTVCVSSGLRLSDCKKKSKMHLEGYFFQDKLTDKWSSTERLMSMTIWKAYSVVFPLIMLLFWSGAFFILWKGISFSMWKLWMDHTALQLITVDVVALTWRSVWSKRYRYIHFHSDSYAFSLHIIRAHAPVWAAESPSSSQFSVFCFECVCFRCFLHHINLPPPQHPDRTEYSSCGERLISLWSRTERFKRSFASTAITSF